MGRSLQNSNNFLHRSRKTVKIELELPHRVYEVLLKGFSLVSLPVEVILIFGGPEGQKEASEVG